MPKVSLYITPKPTLLDAQGRTVQGALHNLGFPSVSEVRIGKTITMEVASDVPDTDIEAMAVRMCETLLANPVTESYRIEVER